MPRSASPFSGGWRASPKELSHEEELTLAILRKEEAEELVDLPARYWLTFPVTPYPFQFLGANSVVASHPFRNKSDADHYLTLLSRIPA